MNYCTIHGEHEQNSCPTCDEIVYGPIEFMSRLPGKGLRMVRVESDPIWSPTLGVWFVWCSSPAWKNDRPWHVRDLPVEAREDILESYPQCRSRSLP